jgi:hypothetical protein
MLKNLARPRQDAQLQSAPKNRHRHQVSHHKSTDVIHTQRHTYISYLGTLSLRHLAPLDIFHSLDAVFTIQPSTPKQKRHRPQKQQLGWASEKIYEIVLLPAKPAMAARFSSSETRQCSLKASLDHLLIKRVPPAFNQGLWVGSLP